MKKMFAMIFLFGEKQSDLRDLLVFQTKTELKSVIDVFWRKIGMERTFAANVAIFGFNFWFDEIHFWYE